VSLVVADLDTIGKLIENSDAVVELRAVKDTPGFFLGMQPVEQADWAGELVDRIGHHLPSRRRWSRGLGHGRRSSWFAAVDKLCYGGGNERRLMVLSDRPRTEESLCNSEIGRFCFFNQLS
jgi:hypothetical protein